MQGPQLVAGLSRQDDHRKVAVGFVGLEPFHHLETVHAAARAAAAASSSQPESPGPDDQRAEVLTRLTQCDASLGRCSGVTPKRIAASDEFLAAYQSLRVRIGQGPERGHTPTMTLGGT